MVDRSKVPEYQIKRVLWYSQPEQSKVIRTQSNPRMAPIWTLKLGRENTFSMRCDRAVREAVSRGWCYVDEGLSLLRPTAAGEALLVERRLEIESSTTVKVTRIADAA